MTDRLYEIDGVSVVSNANNIITWFFTITGWIKNITGGAIDPLLTSKLNKILKDHKISDKFVVKVLPTDEINAFIDITSHFIKSLSNPTFTVYVCAGLVNFLGRDSDKLIAILLHEVGHVILAHVALSYIQTVWQGMIIGGIAKVIFTEDFKDAKLKAWWLGAFYVLASLTMAGVASFLSRLKERKADEFVSKMGYGKALADAFQKFESLRSYKGLNPECGKLCKIATKIESFFRTHPDYVERIKNLLTKEEALKAATNKSKENVTKLVSNEILFSANQYALRKNLQEVKRGQDAKIR